MQKERPRPLDLESWKVGEREGDGERVCALPCPWPRELRQGRRAGASQQLDVLSAVHGAPAVCQTFPSPFKSPSLPQNLQEQDPLVSPFHKSGCYSSEKSAKCSRSQR